jgi:glycosyltransferase involved in cell wall biosynthesis
VFCFGTISISPNTLEIHASRRIRGIASFMSPLLLHVFPTFDPGGAQTRFAMIANNFSGKIRHLVVALDGQFGTAERIDPSVDIVCRAADVRKNSFLANLGTIRGILRAARPDILVTHNWGSIEWVAARLGTGLRHIHIEDGFGPDEAAGQLRRRVLARRLLLKWSIVVVPSHTLQTLARDEWHITEKNLRFIPNGIDVTKFERTSGLKNVVPIVGTVSALRREKNLARLLRAFALTVRAVPCRLSIVGDGPERGALEGLARELGVADHVNMTGHIAEPSREFEKFDIFALASDTEQMPYTVLEAMAAGCPIAATNVGDISQMVATENLPYIVERSDQALSAAMISLLRDSAARAEIAGANLRKVRKDYTQDTMFRAFAQIYALPGLDSI